MLHGIQSWSVGQWICFVLLILTLGLVSFFDKPSWMVPFTAVVIVPLVAALIVTINEPVLTAPCIIVPFLLDLLRDQGITGVIMIGIPLLVIAILILHPQILIPIGLITVCIIGGCAP